MGVGEDPVGEDGMDFDAPSWPPAGVEAANEGVIREGDPGDFYMKVIAKKFRGVWHYGVITGVVTEWVLEDYSGATHWRGGFEDGDTVDLLRSEINRMKAHRLVYREPNPNKKTPIRFVGSASAAWEDAVDVKDHLEKLLDDVRRTVQGSHSYVPILAGRETSRENSFFVYKMLKQVPDADPPPYTTEELESEEDLPRTLLAEREDAKYTTMVARAQHFYLATPPPPTGADSDDSRASARPIRAALCTVWTPERAHTAVGVDLWRVPGGGGGSGGEEALVLLDGPGIRKVAVLMAPADMPSAKAADLGVDAGELLVAGIHARWLRGGWRERSLARLDNPLSPISRLDHGLLRLLMRRIMRIIVA
eukprot:jgi/Tetstr1/464954/TSEL_009688.t1